MLKTRQDLPLGLLLGIALSVFVLSVFSYQATHCTQQQEAVQQAPSTQNSIAAPPQPDRDDGHKKPSKDGKSKPLSCSVIGLPSAVIAFMDHHEGFFVGGFTFCLVIATVLLWRSTRDLWEAGENQIKVSRSVAAVQARNTRRQLKLTEDTAERQLRAYVCVEGVMRSKDPSADGVGFGVAVMVKNTGLSPASEFMQWANIEVREYPLQNPLRIYCRETASRGVLGPNGQTLSIPTFTRNLTTLEEQAILAKGKAIYVYGELDYRDAFGKARRTIFRFQCSGQGYILGAFKADGDGNEAD